MTLDQLLTAYDTAVPWIQAATIAIGLPVILAGAKRSRPRRVTITDVTEHPAADPVLLLPPPACYPEPEAPTGADTMPDTASHQEHLA